MKNETKDLKQGFLGMILRTMRAIILVNMLAGNGFIRAGKELKLVKEQVKWIRIFNAASYFTEFKGLYSRNNLPKIKDGT